MMIPKQKEKHEELSDESNESYSEDDSGDNENDIEESEDDDNDSFTEKIKDEDEHMDAEEENETSGDDQADIKEEKDSKIHQNPGWADAMAKILKTNKPKRKKTIVLAKAKKLKPTSHEDDDDDDPDKKPQTFEVDGVEEKPKIKTDKDSSVKSKAKILKAQLELAKIRKKELESRGRVKPSVLDKDREKVLMKVATKGVVQLFNAVRQQQKSLEQEIKKVGPSNLRQDKVLKSVDKRAFLDVLMGAKSETVPQVKEEPVSTGEWAVLRNDFMMSSKLKDWDKDENDTKA